MLKEVGKILVFFGLISAGIGFLFIIFSKIPNFGKLPGDIYFKKGNFSFYFPVLSCIIISIILTIILNVFLRK